MTSTTVHRFFAGPGASVWTPAGVALPAVELVERDGVPYARRDGVFVQVADFALPTAARFHISTVLQPGEVTRLEVLANYKYGPAWILRDGQQLLACRGRAPDPVPVYAQVSAPAIVPFAPPRGA